MFEVTILLFNYLGGDSESTSSWRTSNDEFGSTFINLVCA
jgi:hypothetical protein